MIENAGQLFAIARRTSNLTINQSAIEIIAGARMRVRIVEIHWVSATATAATYGIGRPAAKGVTPTSPIPFHTMIATAVPATPAGVSTATSALAWGTSPTNPTEYLRRFAFPATAGANYLWRPEELWIPPNETLVIQNITAGVASDVNIIIEERIPA
jgi:hypothetical protein